MSSQTGMAALHSVPRGRGRARSQLKARHTRAARESIIARRHRRRRCVEIGTLQPERCRPACCCGCCKAPPLPPGGTLRAKSTQDCPRRPRHRRWRALPARSRWSAANPGSGFPCVGMRDPDLRTGVSRRRRKGRRQVSRNAREWSCSGSCWGTVKTRLAKKVNAGSFEHTSRTQR